MEEVKGAIARVKNTPRILLETQSPGDLLDAIREELASLLCRIAKVFPAKMLKRRPKEKILSTIRLVWRLGQAVGQSLVADDRMLRQ